MNDISYIKGRLEGLFGLVTLLREMVQETEQGHPMVERIVEHVYTELEEILENMGSHPDTVGVAGHLKKRLQEAKKADPKTKVVQSYDVLTELIATGKEDKKQG